MFETELSMALSAGLIWFCSNATLLSMIGVNSAKDEMTP